MTFDINATGNRVKTDDSLSELVQVDEIDDDDDVVGADGSLDLPLPSIVSVCPEWGVLEGWRGRGNGGDMLMAPCSSSW